MHSQQSLEGDMSADDFPEWDSWLRCCAASANDIDRLARLASRVDGSLCSDLRLQALQSEVVSASRISVLGEMVAMIAHELNQPLSAIVNYTMGSERLVAAQPLDRAKIKDALARAGEQALRAGQVIRDLRAFVANDASKRRFEDLTQVLEDASVLATMDTGGHDVQMRYDIDGDVSRVLIDKVQIQQVLLNLMRNAIEAMASCAHRELTVSAAPAPAGMVEISVSDAGPGLAPETAAQLFQSFITTKPQGMGLGLSISRTIIELHGGRIWLDHSQACGAIFRFTLPTAKAEEFADYV
jgi:two-component system sensor kinase FixL